MPESGSGNGTVTASQHVDAPVAAVWHALTDPQAMARWWVAGDIRPVAGHAFSLDMGAWGVQPCQVTEVEVGRRFAYVFAIGMLDSGIHWTLSPEGDGTRLDLVHDGFNLGGEIGRRAYEGMRRGWPYVLAHLASTIAGDVATAR